MRKAQDQEAVAALRKLVGRRLRAARKAAMLDEDAARRALGHKSITQISLCESGDRFHPLPDLIKLCDLYCVPLDFVTGRVDDPIAEAMEVQESVVARHIGNTVTSCIQRFANAVKLHSAMAITSHRADRREARKASELARQVKDAIATVRRLNPDYEDLRGGSKLELEVAKLIALGESIDRRIGCDEKRMQMIDASLGIEEVESRIAQLRLELTA